MRLADGVVLVGGLAAICLNVFVQCTEVQPAKHVQRVVYECAGAATLQLECAVRVRNECPGFDPESCEPLEPCPKCKVIEECDKRIQEAC